MISAFATEYGLVVAQERTAEKSNEITAIPELLKRLSLEGTVVTIDAMGTQKDIVQMIREKKADYLLALKGNQGNLYDDVKTFFNEKSKAAVWDEDEETDAGHGRIEIRACTVTSDIEWLKERHPQWKDLYAIAKTHSIRIHKKQVTRAQKSVITLRLYIQRLNVSNTLQGHIGELKTGCIGA